MYSKENQKKQKFTCMLFNILHVICNPLHCNCVYFDFLVNSRLYSIHRCFVVLFDINMLYVNLFTWVSCQNFIEFRAIKFCLLFLNNFVFDTYNIRNVPPNKDVLYLQYQKCSESRLSNDCFTLLFYILKKTFNMLSSQWLWLVLDN